jgi:multiple sugar transport system permease protein
MLTKDVVLMKYVIPNTLVFAVVVGPVGYVLQFLLAFFITQAPRRLKKPYIMAIYTPSIAGGVLVSVVWAVFFSGDRLGYLNDFLLKLGSIPAPVAWTQEKEYLLLIMILVTLWGSMGVGFLSLFAGMQNVDRQLYEAGRIDGVNSALKELFYITIPSMKPQMLFSAVMAIVNSLKAGSIGVQLSGRNPTPEYAGQLLQTHIEDYGFARFELGYATALSFALMLAVYVLTQVCFKFLGTKEDE